MAKHKNRGNGAEEAEAEAEAPAPSAEEAAPEAAEAKEDIGPAEAADTEAPAVANQDDDAGGEASDQQAAQLKDQLLRALAESENVRRRADRERADTAKYAITGFARDVLRVADNLRRTLDTVEKGEGDLKALVEGVEVTERDLMATLEHHEVKMIDPLGEKFDYNLHQAMFEVPDADKEPGTVVEVVQQGYVIADRLLRPAMVGVAKTPAPEGDAEADGDPGASVDTEA